MLTLPSSCHPALCLGNRAWCSTRADHTLFGAQHAWYERLMHCLSVMNVTRARYTRHPRSKPVTQGKLTDKKSVQKAKLRTQSSGHGQEKERGSKQPRGAASKALLVGKLTCNKVTALGRDHRQAALAADVVRCVCPGRPDGRQRPRLHSRCASTVSCLVVSLIAAISLLDLRAVAHCHGHACQPGSNLRAREAARDQVNMCRARMQACGKVRVCPVHKRH